MRRREEDDDASRDLLCERCQQMVERALVGECSFCFKRFCRDCAVRSGNAEFCSKACAQGWFFADSEEDPGDPGEE
jgi:hypothetical protein